MSSTVDNDDLDRDNDIVSDDLTYTTLMVYIESFYIKNASCTVEKSIRRSWIRQ